MTQLALLLAAMAVSDVTAKPQAAAKPNILFVFTDDQRWDTIHALGNAETHTPVQDRLVETGFYFNNSLCQGSMIGAVCLPSRTMLITGQSLWHCPQKMRDKTCPAGTPLLPKVMADAGYVTWHCGKSGNASPFGNAAFQTNIIIDHRIPTTSQECAEKAITFLKSLDTAKPFFMYLAPPVPHDPRVAPERFVKMYDPAKVTLSKNFMPRHPFDNGELRVRDELLAPIPRTEADMRQHLADYYAAISNFDYELGRILDTVKARGLTERTIVIYSSDQGLAVGGRHGLMGKQNLYEHVKPPLMLAGPGIPHGRSDALVYLYDLFPTICELGGATIPTGVEGKSLLPVVRGEMPRVRETMFGAYRDCQRMIRDERWKLIKYNAKGVKNVQLFDLKNDPDEINNLAGDPKYAGERERLEKLLLAARKEFSDPVDFENVGPKQGKK
jgi:arylsulfatase A-like enzyme